MKRMIGRATLLFCFLAVSGLLHAITIPGQSIGYQDLAASAFSGAPTGGQSIDYQQVFTASAFSGTTTIYTMTWYYDTIDGGNPLAIGGAYTFYLGYSANPVNGLSSNLASNIMSETLLGTATIPPGGINDNPTLTLSGFTFTYDPTVAPLLLEVVVDNQDPVPNGSGNGYNQADDSGSVTSRAYCLTVRGCFADSEGLVTTFGEVSGGSTTIGNSQWGNCYPFMCNGNVSTPEPASLTLLGSGLVGLAGLLRRKLIA